jgi:ribonuclease G
LPWFRRRRQEAADPTPAAPAPTEPEQPVVTDTPAPETESAESDPTSTKPKRRRGTRGGRGRKKPSTGADVAKAEPAAEPKPARKKADRKPEKVLSQRKERQQQQPRRRPQRRAPLPQAKRELIVSVDVSEQRVAVLEDDRVAEVYLERPERRSIAGNIYLGVVDNVLPGMEAAFVEIGLEKNGFLYVDEIVVPELEGRHHGRKIQDLITRGQTILVQAVKDPMKTKGARLTTQISLPGRFVVFVPQGDGLGVSRRLDDDERNRLKDILKKLNVKEGGVIVRTAAEGASEEDIERDLVFLQRLWKSIQARAATVKAPVLVYQEAELPLRVVRDLFTGDFEKAVVDNDRAYKRIVGYLKKTSPHMVERVVRYKDKPPLMEAFGVDAEIRSTLHRRVDLPSGGYLVFDYAEAFTVIDVNTGRFVGGRGKNSGARLEDTITKNNLEAVKEVVRQLRLRDIGGIIVIDFIDMANPKNRQQVEEALRNELDRTKTYVVEISPLGLVEMTRQNVTDGPREVMTKKCPTCGGDGIVLSEYSAAVEIERKLKALSAGSRSQAYRVEVASEVASILIGPGAARLQAIEEVTKRRFFLEGKPHVHLDHFLVLAEGKLVDLAPKSPIEEGAELRLDLVEVGRHDVHAAVGKVDGLDVCVGDAAPLVGKKVKVRVERVLDGTAYASLVQATRTKAGPEPLTAEGEAEKPTRKPPARKGAAAATTSDEPEETPLDAADEPADVAIGEAVAEEAGETETAPGEKKKTRRGSRGGRNRRKKPAAAETGEATVEDEAPVETESHTDEPSEPAAESQPLVRIHVPAEEIGRDGGAESDTDGDDAAEKAKRKTRRGSRGGRNRRKKPAELEAATNGDAPTAESEPTDDAEPTAESEPTADAEPAAEAEPEPGRAPEPDAEPEPQVEPEPELEPAAEANGGNYVPMSEWIDDFERSRG